MARAGAENRPSGPGLLHSIKFILSLACTGDCIPCIRGVRTSVSQHVLMSECLRRDHLELSARFIHCYKLRCVIPSVPVATPQAWQLGTDSTLNPVEWR